MLSTVKSPPHNHDGHIFTSYIYGNHNKDDRATPQRDASVDYFISARARRLHMDESQHLYEWLRKYQANPKDTVKEIRSLLFKELSIIAWINSQHEVMYDPLDDSNDVAPPDDIGMVEPRAASPSSLARSFSPIPPFIEDHEDYALHLRANRLRHMYQQAGDLCTSVRRELFLNDAARIHAVENACYTIQSDCKQRLKECHLLRLELKNPNKRVMYSSPPPYPRNIGNTRVFATSLGSYKKDDLKEIASALGLDQYGTKNGLLSRIRTHMGDHPELAADERFRGLFGRRKRLASICHPL